MNLFVTADKIGTPTGGGVVTYHESEALRSLGPCEVWDRDKLQGGSDPWGWDEILHTEWAWFGKYREVPGLSHFYSGSFPKTVGNLITRGSKVSYTIAAHDKEVSRREHERLGFDFPYTHLTDSGLWNKYIEGYRLADTIICPSKVAAETVRGYNSDFASKRIEVIPHGCDLPSSEPFSMPRRFTVGYLGAVGVDKGLRYLLEAWRKLGWKDAMLILAGKDTTTPWFHEFAIQFGGGSMWLAGWVPNVSDFYNQISLYIQPSATEGFGIEVLEAMAHKRPVICSEGAGASDLVPAGWTVPACNVDELVRRIRNARDILPTMKPDWFQKWRDIAEAHTWDKIRERYIQLWKGML